MEKLAPIGRSFFAVSLVSFGIQQFLFGDFVPGRAPGWPASLPGRLVWAGLSGLVLIAVGAAIALGKNARAAVVLASAIVFVWAFLRNIPAALADTHYGVAWTNLWKGLALVGGALAVAGSLPQESGGTGGLSAIGRSKAPFLWAGRVCLGIFLVSSGIQHFLFAQFVDTLVPAWIPPNARFWTYFAAVALIAGGLGMIVPWTTRLAAALSGLMIFLWVLMLHIPRALAAPEAQLRNEWTAVFEALAYSGIALCIAGSSPGKGR